MALTRPHEAPSERQFAQPVTVPPKSKYDMWSAYLLDDDTTCEGEWELDSVIAIGTAGGANDRADKEVFARGFIELIERKRPTDVVVYGPMRDDMLPPLYARRVRLHHIQSRTSEVFEQRRGEGA